MMDEAPFPHSLSSYMHDIMMNSQYFIVLFLSFLSSNIERDVLVSKLRLMRRKLPFQKSLSIHLSSLKLFRLSAVVNFLDPSILSNLNYTYY
jgi:hypothetical protein